MKSILTSILVWWRVTSMSSIPSLLCMHFYSLYCMKISTQNPLIIVKPDDCNWHIWYEMLQEQWRFWASFYFSKYSYQTFNLYANTCTNKSQYFFTLEFFYISSYLKIVTCKCPYKREISKITTGLKYVDSMKVFKPKHPKRQETPMLINKNVLDRTATIKANRSNPCLKMF